MHSLVEHEVGPDSCTVPVWGRQL